VRDHPQTLPQENVTLAEMLSAAGYRSAAFVTHPFVAPEHDFDQGFEFYHHRRRYAKRQAAQAVAWIKKHADEPFFLWYEAKPTHYPCWAPKELMRPEALPVDLAISRHSNDRRAPEGLLGRLMFEFESLDYTDHQFASMMAFYDAAVSFCDRLTGMIVDQLRASGVLDNTVVIVVADHGDAHGEHGLYFNHSSNLYQPTVRVPLIVRLPGGQRAGQRVGTVTRNIDLVPTLADLAGVAVPPGVDGASLLPVLDGKDQPRDAFAESGVFRQSRAGLANYRQYSPGPAGKWRMIRRGNYKLIHIPGQTGLRADDYELYDLAADPLEQFDLAQRSPDVVERLAGALAEWFGNYSHTAVTPAAPDQDETDDLRALGYVD
jgi:arylsulfatase A-like enzyme